MKRNRRIKIEAVKATESIEAVALAYYFASDSDPDKIYETMQFTNGRTSCNCPGWTRRIDSRGQRSCKHTRMIDAGLAKSIAKKFVDYGRAIIPQVETSTATQIGLNIGSRRFNFES